MAAMAFKAFLLKLSMQICSFICVGGVPSNFDHDNMKYIVVKVIIVVTSILRSLLSYRDKKNSQILIQDHVFLHLYKDRVIFHMSIWPVMTSSVSSLL